MMMLVMTMMGWEEEDEEDEDEDGNCGYCWRRGSNASGACQLVYAANFKMAYSV